MPDAAGVEERVQSGAVRHSAEQAFGGEAQGEVPSEAVQPDEGGETTITPTLNNGF
jgi:hypothetical protein